MALAHRTAVVYGAATTIGGAIAAGLTVEGAHCILVDTDPCGLEAVAGRIRSAGGSAETAVLDTTDAVGVGDHGADVAARTGGLDIAVVPDVPAGDLVVGTIARYLREASGVVLRVTAPGGTCPATTERDGVRVVTLLVSGDPRGPAAELGRLAAFVVSVPRLVTTCHLDLTTT